MDSGESAPAVPFEPQLLSAKPVATAVVHGMVRFTDLREFFDVSFRGLMQTASEQRVPITSPTFGLFHGPMGDRVQLEVGFPVGRSVRADGVVVASRLPGGLVARITHGGAFDGLGDAWARLDAWLRSQGLTPSAQQWESYVTQPSPDMDPSALRTELNWIVDKQ
jgi:effector-binding domain-containing protein